MKISTMKATWNDLHNHFIPLFWMIHYVFEIVPKPKVSFNLFNIIKVK